MKLLHRLLPLAIGLLWLTTALSGCHSSKQAERQAYEPSTVSTTADSLLEAIATQYRPWERLKAPVKVAMESPSRFSVSASAIMERDKSILFSLRFLGMEVGVAYITPDTLLVVDKYHNQYISESLRNFLGGTSFAFANLQDLLLGRPFLFQQEAIDASNVGMLEASLITDDRASTEDEKTIGEVWMVMPDTAAASAVGGVTPSYGFLFDSSAALLKLIVQAGTYPPLIFSYLAPYDTPCGPMASGLTLYTNAQKRTIQASIDWELSKAQWDADVNLRSVSIPKGCKRIYLTDLLKAFSNLQ
ncbi:MAG: DUF4292 domain-containing protein [Bacteroidales bacterium]|nr:DUF4292 domain-containing protein [Bacteroidales bacterium]